MNNEMNELMQISRNMLAGINSLGEQMGIVNTRIGNLEVKTAQIERRMDTYENDLRVTRPQADAIRRAIHAKACEVLDIKYKDGIPTSDSIEADTLYRPGFISKIYSDARKFSCLGTPYYDTLRKDYGTVLNYINGWAPQVGIPGYKAYLDERRRLREK